ncbi:hypothetical protein [Sphingobium sp. SA916]|uniref:hypothetical protein n=1 Tax=Sphingobium sp. SA916 TaxID=1851207 RepID=UPI001559D0F8|nr:hypothetical protein [Sphingobium sp. SA916]
MAVASAGFESQDEKGAIKGKASGVRSMSEDKEVGPQEWEKLKNADEHQADSAEANRFGLDEEGRNNLVFMIVTLIGLLLVGLLLGIYW